MQAAAVVARQRWAQVVQVVVRLVQRLIQQVRQTILVLAVAEQDDRVVHHRQAAQV
jgi:hypothetical protein